MTTINTNSNAYTWYIQNAAQTQNTQQVQTGHHHHKIKTQDSTELSQDALQSLSTAQPTSTTAPVNPLDSLVANGTITQDQENAIKSAFQAARQSSISGVYSSKQTNPVSNLIANGTITQDQASAIQNAFLSARQANQNTEAVSGSQEQAGVHHHHHRHQAQAEQNSVLDSLVSNGTITQDQENSIDQLFNTSDNQ